jgi:outer membrane protein TolC
VVRAQSQTGQVRYDALLLEELEHAEIARLNALLDREPGAPVGNLEEEPVSPLLFGLEEIYTMAESHREEILLAEVMIEKASAGVELARNENRPEFKAGVLYSSIGDPDVASPPPNAGEDAFGVQFGVSIPLWLEKNRGRTARAHARLNEARADHKNQINDTKASIRRLYFQLSTAERTLRLYEDELLPQAAKSLTIAETWFREGQSSFSDFVEAQAVWYNFSLAVARARADYGKNLARLEKAVGRSLTHPAAETNPGSSEEDS